MIAGRWRLATGSARLHKIETKNRCQGELV
jgi:hypothetical protein